jgi:hypothetical protein
MAEVLYEVELPSGANLLVPVSTNVNTSDPNFLEIVLRWIKGNADVMDPGDMWYINTFIENPTRVPFVIKEYI